MNTPVAPNPPAISQSRARLVLVLIAAMFLSSFGVAAYLRFIGWHPGHSKNFGELLQPPRDLSAASLQRADGQPYAWTPEASRWRVVLVAPDRCGAPCATMLDTLGRVWETQGRQADRVDVLWFGPLPTGAPGFRRLVPMRRSPELDAALPEISRADALSVYLIDPSGFLVMRYAPGFDPNHLRKDLAQLLK